MKFFPTKLLLRSWSFQLISVGIMLQSFWIELPTEMKEKVPQETRDYITFVFLVIAFLARSIKQDIKS